MQNAHYDLTAAKVANVYSPLKPGLWQLEGWGGYLLVLPFSLNPNGGVLCLDINAAGQVESSCCWHLGPHEQLAEPARVMRDEHMCDEDREINKVVHY